jgi:hypothetical protein
MTDPRHAPADGGDLARNARRRRIVPIAVLALFLMLVLGLLSIPFVARHALPVVSASAPLPFAGQIGASSVEGRLELSADGDFRVLLRHVAHPPSSGDRWRPNLVLAMPDHAMPPIAPAFRPLADGYAEAAGTLPMPGRWELRVETPDGRLVFPFFVEE